MSETQKNNGFDLSSLAREFDIHRQTVAKRIFDAGIEPVSNNGRVRFYKLSEVAPLLCSRSPEEGGWENVNPDSLPPLEQQQYWSGKKLQIQKERESDELKKERGLLLDFNFVEYTVAALLRQAREGMLIIPDSVEAEAGLSTVQRKRMDATIDRLLTEMAEKIANLFDEEE